MLAAQRLEHIGARKNLAYFTLAPYGGNIEGIHAATEAGFRKRQSVSRQRGRTSLHFLNLQKQRPDRHPERA